MTGHTALVSCTAVCTGAKKQFYALLSHPTLGEPQSVAEESQQTKKLVVYSRELTAVFPVIKKPAP